MDYSPLLKPLQVVTNFSKLPHKISTNNKSSQTCDENLLGNLPSDTRKIEAENHSLKTLLKCRENEICKLKREIHKLKVSILFIDRI